MDLLTQQKIEHRSEVLFSAILLKNFKWIKFIFQIKINSVGSSILFTSIMIWFLCLMSGYSQNFFNLDFQFQPLRFLKILDKMKAF